MQDLIPRSRGGRAALSLALVLGLLAAVAIASTGDTPVGGSGVRRPADRLTDVAVSLVLVAVVAGAPLVLLLLFFRRHAQQELQRLGLARRRGPLGTILALAVLGAFLVGWLVFASGGDDRRSPQVPRVAAAPTAAEDASRGEQPYRPRFDTTAVLVVLGIGAAATLAAALSYRARRRALGSGDEPGLALEDVLEETLDDLRAEPDPRRAVIAAYARLERALGAYGLPRRRAEAPVEYLRRVLAELEVGRHSVERLTALFARAKFSRHAIGAATKEEAIAALETVREELRGARARAEAERAAAAAARARAAAS